jgi:hypothetical protein
LPTASTIDDLQAFGPAGVVLHSWESTSRVASEDLFCSGRWLSGKVASGGVWRLLGMRQNFIVCDREQSFLLPPSLLEWVPEDHLVWTILGAVDELDLTGIYRAYRPDGHGRPAYEPRMMG